MILKHLFPCNCPSARAIGLRWKAHDFGSAVQDRLSPNGKLILQQAEVSAVMGRLSTAVALLLSQKEKTSDLEAAYIIFEVSDLALT